jgi:hypothetical protein
MKRERNQAHSTDNRAMSNNLAAGTVLSYTYDAGTNPGKTRTATFRNYIDSKGGPAMYCYDGTLLKKYLLHNVRNILIEDEATGIYSTEPTSEQWWRHMAYLYSSPLPLPSSDSSADTSNCRSAAEATPYRISCLRACSTRRSCARVNASICCTRSARRCS